jgi:hypothetical protein
VCDDVTGNLFTVEMRGFQRHMTVSEMKSRLATGGYKEKY